MFYLMPVSYLCLWCSSTWNVSPTLHACLKKAFLPKRAGSNAAFYKKQSQIYPSLINLSIPLILFHGSIREFNKLDRNSTFTGLLSVLPAGLWPPWGPIMHIWSILETSELMSCFIECASESIYWIDEWNIALAFYTLSPPFLTFSQVFHYYWWESMA